MYYIIIILMTFIGSVAAFYLKKASSTAVFRKLLYNKYFYIGGGLYFLSALLNIFVLKYIDYSVVLPLTSITYIWTMIISSALLGEHITKNKIIGVFAIMLGAIFVVI